MTTFFGFFFFLCVSDAKLFFFIFYLSFFSFLPSFFSFFLSFILLVRSGSLAKESVVDAVAVEHGRGFDKIVGEHRAAVVAATRRVDAGAVHIVIRELLDGHPVVGPVDDVRAVVLRVHKDLLRERGSKKSTEDKRVNPLAQKKER